MKVHSINEVKQILKHCKVTHVREVKPSGFYTLKAHEVRFPDGQLVTREYVDKNPAAIILPITDSGDIVFVVQPISNVAEGSLLELPAGYGKNGEPPEETAVRELLEETGYSPEHVENIGCHYQDPGLISQSVSEFIATNCRLTDEQKLDKGEYIKFLEIPPSLIPELTKAKLILDSNTVNTLYNAIILGRLKPRSLSLGSANKDITAEMSDILSDATIAPTFTRFPTRVTPKLVDFDPELYAEKLFIRHYQKGIAKILSVRKSEFDDCFSGKTLDCIVITIVIEGSYPSVTVLEFLYFSICDADDEPALIIRNSGYIVYQRDRKQNPRSQWMINNLSHYFRKNL